MMEGTNDENIVDLEKMISDPSLDQIYFNGFTVNMTLSDFKIILLHDNRPVGFLETTHTIVKTLSNQIDLIVKNFESDTESKINTIDELENNLNRHNKK